MTRNSQRLGDVVGATTVVHRRNALQPFATRRAGYLARGVFFAVLAAVLAFTAFFDYFGRPPLVIQGLYNERQLVFKDVTSYSLGQPGWASGKVTYPITTTGPTATCTGWIELDWEGLAGWQASSAAMNCPPS